MREARATGEWPLVHGAWVYPPGALVVMLPLLVMSTPAGAGLAWIGVAFLLNVVVVRRLLVRPNGVPAAWWWVCFVLLCGAVAVTRLESIVAPMTVLALLARQARPLVGASLVSFAGWIKLAPFVWLVPMTLFTARRASSVIAAFIAATAIVIVPFFLFGARGTHLLSFLSSQNARGLQAESPWALGLQVERVFGAGGDPVYDEHWGTVQFVGSRADQLARSADVVLPLLVFTALALIVRAAWVRRAADVPSADVFVAAGTVLTCALVLANKVGSPQFSLWFAPGIACLIVAGLDRVRVRRWAVIGLVMAAATQVEYPMRMNSLDADPWGLAAVAIRYLCVTYFALSAARMLLERPQVRS
ncbi:MULTISPECIES: glycosyltransferase 87 family protein [Aeromicrobium]|uniref:glycosyltransferase 87 family protein n=1 Tax=Aeromicrobium TaxID=2040 RepID=UPI002104510F|nr:MULTISPECIES: glycosyltransferase 87 family protein [Aeromicrobium]